MQTILDYWLRRLIVRGRLRVIWPDGTRTLYDGTQGFTATMRICDRATVRRLALNPALAVGEAYMEGGLEPVGCTLLDLLMVLVDNTSEETSEMPMLRVRSTLRRLGRRLTQFNPAGRARRNVAHHYDLDARLYSRFLDTDQQYSCAYFPRGDETLEAAQRAKKRHIAAKLKLDRPDLEVLDIGSGWGGLALTLARDYGARVTGITLSTEQLNAAQARARQAGLADRVHFELLDYRAVNRRFDRIVSIGMFEHVGVVHFDAFFAAVRRALAPDGVALLHAIGRCSPPSATNAWIAKYIFPGGYCPGLSEVFPAIERSGLWATDVEIQRLHYAETLRHWSGRFAAHRDDIAGIYDERFCRMFEFYLAASEASFRTGGMMVFQIQLTADVHALPITRDYMLDAEQSAAAASDRPDATGRAPPQNPPQNAPQNAPSARARHQDPVAMTPVAMTPVAMRTDGDGS